MGNVTPYDEINMLGHDLDAVSRREVARNTKAIRDNVQPLHDDVANIESRLVESYNQINILRKELQEERDRLIEVQKHADKAEKRSIWFPIVCGLASIALDNLIQYFMSR